MAGHGSMSRSILVTTTADSNRSASSYDPIAIHDAIHDSDLPKVDDFVDQLLIVLHGLRDDRVETYEVDCFVTPNLFVTFHAPGAPAVDSLFAGVQQHAELAVGGCSDLAARLADGFTRRLLAVIDAFDDRTDGLIAQALIADSSLLADVTTVRTDLSKIHHSVAPRREALDLLEPFRIHD